MECLLDKTILLKPADSKTNLDFPMTISREYAALFIRTAYDPKIVADEELARQQIEAGAKRYIPEEALKNLGSWRNYLPVLNFVTLSLDYEDEYIGCAHRHSPVQDHIISQSYSSPGFYRHAVLPGVWRCVLNCHAVVDELVTYSLRVYGAEENEELHDHIQAF